VLWCLPRNSLLIGYVIVCRCLLGSRTKILQLLTAWLLAGTVCLSEDGVLFLWGSGVSVHEAFHAAAKPL
jgi:hypothetical protein